MGTPIKVNQEKVLEFMTKVVSLKENEQFSLKKVSLCSQFYTFFPQTFTTGHMFIIGNEGYWKDALGFGDENYNKTDCHYASTVNENNRAILFKIGHTLSADTPYKFKKMSKEFCGESRISEYPYLDEAVQKLQKNAQSGIATSDDEVIAYTLTQIENENNGIGTTTNQAKSPREIEKSLIKRLNGSF